MMGEKVLKKKHANFFKLSIKDSKSGRKNLSENVYTQTRYLKKNPYRMAALWEAKNQSFSIDKLNILYRKEQTWSFHQYLLQTDNMRFNEVCFW